MRKQHHLVIIRDKNGEPSRFPLKTWVRNNLNSLPHGLDPDIQTSHQVRGRLSQNGWQIEFTENEVLVIKPDDNGSFDYANNYIKDTHNVEDIESIESEEALEMTFGLERDMQAALRKNIESLEKGLVIIDSGKERTTEAGRIDITAKDINNRTIIIEIKAIDAKPEVIAQTLAYMEAIKTEDKAEVRGIIVASDFPVRVKLAARQISNLKRVKYSIQFAFNEIV